MSLCDADALLVMLCVAASDTDGALDGVRDADNEPDGDDGGLVVGVGGIDPGWECDAPRDRDATAVPVCDPDFVAVPV